MNPSFKESYPSTWKFELFLIDKKLMVMHEGGLFWNLPLSPDEEEASRKIGFNKVQDAAQILHEMLGEYEHGTVDMSTVLEMANDPVMAHLASLYYSSGHKLANEAEMERLVKAAESRAIETLRGIYEDILETMLAFK